MTLLRRSAATVRTHLRRCLHLSQAGASARSAEAAIVRARRGYAIGMAFGGVCLLIGLRDLLGFVHLSWPDVARAAVEVAGNTCLLSVVGSDLMIGGLAVTARAAAASGDATRVDEQRLTALDGGW